jgi:pimeloyl-ACP methyl ester carboxylesterase
LQFQYREGFVGPIPPQQLSLSVTAGSLPFSVGVTTNPAGDTWLFPSASSGVATTSATSIAIDVEQHLPAGKYSGTIVISAPGATNPLVDVPVTLTVSSVLPPSSKPAVIIVPGVLGTKLATGDEVVWLSNQTLNDSFLKLNDLDLLQFDANGVPTTTLSVDAITPQGNFGDIFNLYSLRGDPQYALDCGTVLASAGAVAGFQCQANTQIYNNLYNELRAQQFPTFTFPYDWRTDIDQLSEELYSYIAAKEAEGFTNIALVAHSMGGLIVGQLLFHHQQDVTGSLQTIITLGTPFQGSVQTYLYFQGWGPDFITLVISAAEMQRIGSNWTSSYELLPRYNFVTLGRTTVPYAQVYNGTYLAPALPRQDAVSQAYALWEDQIPSSLIAYAIIGSGQQTPVAIVEASGSGCPEAVLGDGDGTVPLTSAQGSSWITTDQVWYANVLHAQLPGNSAVITAITDILTGKSPTTLSKTPLGAAPGLIGCL